MMKLLLIEDDYKIAEFIIKGLEEKGIFVTHFINGEDGLYSALNEDHDFFIFDIMLPTINGLEIVSKLRESGNQKPVVILSAKDSLKDKLDGFNYPIDDYITKPFSILELYARINAISRRQSRLENTPKKLVYEEIELDFLNGVCKINGEKVELNPQELKIMNYFLSNQGQVLTKTILLDQIWGYNFLPEANVVEVSIYRLRKKISKYTNRDYLQTVRGLGYRLK